MKELGYTFREAPRTMNNRLRERDEERERIAKEEQAKMVPDRDTYNRMIGSRQSPPFEQTSEPYSEQLGSHEFQHVMGQQLEAEFGLSALPTKADETTGIVGQLEALKSRVHDLDGL